MTTEEKLQRFHDICMEDAKAHYKKVVQEYEEGLKETLAEHLEDVKRRQDMRIRIETEKIKKEIKRRLSADQLKIKRQVSLKQDEYKDKLFQEAADKLRAYRETAEYRALLEKQIRDIQSFAKDKECEIFLCPGDQGLLGGLPAGVKVSDEDFLGGTLAVIPSMNIFIDNSFRTRLEQEKHDFSFTTGGGQHGKQ